MDEAAKRVDPNCLPEVAVRYDGMRAVQQTIALCQQLSILAGGVYFISSHDLSDRLGAVHLIGKEKLADNTVRRRSGIAKQFFRAALRRKLIASNPFADLKAAVQANKSREFFITRDMAMKVTESCPNAEWRLIFALSRFGGLHCPSEHLALKWGDVNWNAGRILVRSPKTEHHAGGESRLVPLFPQLRQPLMDAFVQAAEGAEYVITKYREPGVNLRTQLERIIGKAGLIPWPKLFQNLRSTRETELAETWPEHVVCAWIGNSKLVARKHYFQLRDEHFAQAAGLDELGEQAAHNAAQYTAESSGIEREVVGAGMEKTAEMQGDSARYDATRKAVMGGKGLEPLTFAV